MFYKIKSKIISKSIDKRNKENAFNYLAAESFKICPEDDPIINNSYYFSAHEGELSIFLRLGIRSNIVETWFVILDKDDKYSLKQETFSDISSSPLKVFLKDDVWNISFNGLLNHNDIEDINVSFEASFVSNIKYIDFSSDMPSIRMAKAIAQEKWNKAFFNNLNNVSGQTHYEQVGRFNGHYIIRDKKKEFDLPCVRDHSFGKRDWNYMNNHLWLMGVSSQLDQFNYSLVSYPVISVLEVGNYLCQGQMNYLLSSDIDLSLLSKGQNLESIKLKVHLDNGQDIEVEAKVIDTTLYHFQNDDYTLIENIAIYHIGDKTLKGILEVGFNKDHQRLFNHKDIRKIKR